MPPDQNSTELEGILLNTAESKDLAEATLLETSRVKEAVEGLEAPLEAIALALNSDEEEVVDDGAVITVKGRRGLPGKDADPVAVASALSADESFTSKIKGEKGDTPVKGEDYYTEEERAELLREATPVKGVDYFDEDDVEVLVREAAIRAAPLVERPEDGKDSKPEDVAKLLKKDPAFQKAIKGEKGDEGGPDTGTDIVKKITDLKGDERLSYKALKDRPDIAGGSKTPGGGGGQDVAVYDETTLLTSVLKQLQFVGAGVTAVQINDGVIVVTIPGNSGGANIATEAVTATDAGGNNVNIDLTQLAHAWSTVEFVSRNGAIQDRTKWSIVGDTLTLTGAVSTNSFQVQYTYA